MKILALCDSPTMTTGFGRVAQNLFRRWNKAGHLIDCWGIGFKGWGYKDVPYVNTLFPGGGGGEWCLSQNLELFLKHLLHGDYTHVWLMQDSFLLRLHDFPAVLNQLCRKKGIVSCLYFPVDAPLDPEWVAIIAAVDIPIAYTHYGKAEAEKALEKAVTSGWDALTAGGKLERCVLADKGNRIHVIPHGVDTSIYKPLPDRMKVRREFWKQRWVEDDDFLMVNVNANQRRKDVVRSLEILAGLKARGKKAKLVMHMPERSFEGLSLNKIADQLGLERGKDWGHHDAFFKGSISSLSEADLVRLYNAADLYLTTSLGEGWGLGITEALACGCQAAIPAHTSCFEIHLELRQRQFYRTLLLPTEDGYVGLENDNNRLRPRVDVGTAVGCIQTDPVERLPLNDAGRAWLSWDRIAKEFLQLMKQGGKARPHPHERETEPQASPQTLDGRMNKFTYYLEFGGGLGDVFNQLYHRGAYNVLRDLQPGETARVCLVTHNPFVKELFAWHPKKDQLTVEDLGYWHTQEENDRNRALHQMPPLGALPALPEEQVNGMQFYPSTEDRDLVTRYRALLENGYVVLSASAGLPERDIPPHLVTQIVGRLRSECHTVVVVGRDYDRHGRREQFPEDLADDPRVLNFINQLSVPGVAWLVQASAGLVTCHSALSILGWRERKPMLLLYPPSCEHHIRAKDQWAFGVDYPECVAARFDAYERDPEAYLSPFLSRVLKGGVE